MTSPHIKSTEAAPGPWWGPLSLAPEQCHGLHLGGLQLAVQRLPHEWRCLYESDPSLLESTAEQTWQAGMVEVCPELKQVVRFVVSAGQLQLLPKLADRPVICRPVMPLTIPSGEAATLYVSLPLWIQLLAEKNKEALLDIPVQRPSDTWFGPSTTQGELCYATRTQGRMQLEEVPLRTYRAVTAVTIENHAESSLLLERLSLPAPQLSLFATPEHQLWTQAVTLVREDSGDLASLLIAKEPPAQAGPTTLVSGPRAESEKGSFIRAFSAWFE